MIDELYVENLLNDPTNISNFVEAHNILYGILGNEENDDFLVSLSHDKANQIFDRYDYVNSILAKEFVKNYKKRDL